ncbi:MAG: ABC-F family ATP-binding cassette domain-containing protein [Chlamydiales bacterium]|nr:ABC-F family ATP-binding cassette domain-containing protein [Chlamydiales bacterium]
MQFDSITKAFAGETILDRVSFIVGKGERCGLIGRNGSGKSTLLRMLIGEESEDAGTIAIPKDYRLGYLQQHISFSKETIIEEAALGLPKGYEDHLYLVETILFGLGFTKADMDRPPKDLSGGYHLRLHLAKVLVSDPDCLLLDEPTNYLDIVSIRWLRDFLKNWRKEFILITHDRAFMDSVTTHTLGIHRNKVRKMQGDTETLFSQILLEEQVHEKTRLKLDKKREQMESYIRRFGAKATKAKQAQSRAKAITKMPTLEQLAQIHDLDFTFTPAPFPGKKLLGGHNITFSYNEETPLIDSVSLQIERDDRIAIIGKNGRGKSTLLNLLAGEIVPHSGHIKNSPNLALGYFGQTNINRLHTGRTIEEEVASTRPDLTTSQARQLCGVMMFPGDKAKKTISVLSGGERSRVLLAKILAQPCNLLFLDEPTHHLDMESIESLITAINEFPGAVVIVTHSEKLLQELDLTKVVVCRADGQQVIEGDYVDFLDRGGWEETGASKKRKNLGKERKQQRAEIIQTKNRALKPLKEEIRTLEQKITKLENEQQITEKALIVASHDNDGASIANQSARLTEIKTSIDALFEQLETATTAFHQEELSYDRQLTELD